MKTGCGGTRGEEPGQRRDASQSLSAPEKVAYAEVWYRSDEGLGGVVARTRTRCSGRAPEKPAQRPFPAP